MHPRQQKLAKMAANVTESLSKTAAPILWEYETEDGKKFYLEERLMVVRNPFTGKTMSVRPKKKTMPALTKGLREDEGV